MTQSPPRVTPPRATPAPERSHRPDSTQMPAPGTSRRSPSVPPSAEPARPKRPTPSVPPPPAPGLSDAAAALSGAAA
ncbi:hypothetical protein QHF83_34175, partial [Polyangium sp. 15x6]|nr:hypothetical protein [Polyangium sp. 15x6]